MIFKLVPIVIIILTVAACDNSNAQGKIKIKNISTDHAELQKFVRSLKSNLIFVQGGEFLMGDFGAQYGKQRLPFDGKKDSIPLHKVELTSYSINKFKTTNQEYQFYLKFNNLPLRKADNHLSQVAWDDYNKLPDIPAQVDWYEADKYCSWLAKITNLRFSLPTEAQWEYAARSRGKFLPVATDSGDFKVKGRNGINISAEDDREAYAKKMGSKLESLISMPVDSYPPNPLGLYDMSGNGFEWVKDWYDPDYYKHSPVKDPQGPAKPEFKDSDGFHVKVLRSVDLSNPFWGNGLTISRTWRAMNNYDILPRGKTVRCVVNSTYPIDN